MLRTHTLGELRATDKGQSVIVAGWVQSCRNLGGLIFIALRDHYGITQVVIDPATQPEIAALAQELRDEFVIKVSGQVSLRPENMVNQAMPTGEIEITVTALEILSRSLPLPFSLAEDKVGLANESLRLEYRFLDLRRPSLQEMLASKDQLIRRLRQYFQNQNFTEIQTPILANSSPEGARDFLIPSRIYPGHCYALPQAPQQFKQLLMIGGLDRYFQIAPCFRDEDTRLDRHYGEFYQLDLEMSFIDSEEDIWQIIEPLMVQLTNEFSDKKIIDLVDNRFPRLTWHEAMERYGSDKPDLRFALSIKSTSQLWSASNLSIFKDILAAGGVINSLILPETCKLSRKQLDELVELAKKKGLGGLGYLIAGNDGWQGSLAKNTEPEILQSLQKDYEVTNGQTVLVAAGPWLEVCQALGAVRGQIAKWFDLADKTLAAWCWVIDFPFFEAGETVTGIDFAHNPFSMPKGGLEALKNSDPLQIVAHQFDLVLNGFEVASGAIRNHQPEIMYQAFKLVGYEQVEVDRRFGAMIEAFKYGAPPHGGIAPGIDRLLMVLKDYDSIRDIYAFPKDGQGRDLLMKSPSPVDQKQLDDLHLSWKTKENKQA